MIEMKRLLVILTLLLCGLAAGAQELNCTFVQKKTLKAVDKVIPGEGTVSFKAPDHLVMTYTVPAGEYLIIEGNELRTCVKGKELKVDTSKNPRITGAYVKAAEENDATLIVEDKGGVTKVSIMAKQAQPTGYSKIIIEYNKKGLPVRMVLDEFTGIETDYTFKY